MGSPYQYWRSLGVSGGILCYASLYQGLSVWYLKSSIRDKTARWDNKYTQLNVYEAIFTRLEILGLYNHGPHYRYNCYFDKDMALSPC